jgi:flavin-dependent dehydrogenase
MIDTERDVMEYDVVVVGAGPAGLACAIRLKQLSPDTTVCVIEKASTIGAHILSGAVIEPEPLDALLPGWRDNPPPICVPVTHDEFLLMTKTSSIKAPIVPPQMHNKGNFIVSLGALCAWLAPQAEALGVEIYPGFAAAETLHDEDGRVAGVRIGDMGVAKDGSHKPGFTQGIDIRAKVTVLAEGARGHLTKRLDQAFPTSPPNSDPQGYSIGIKELWQVPEERVSPGKIVHSLGWPGRQPIYGGSFLYHLDKGRIALGTSAAWITRIRNTSRGRPSSNGKPPVGEGAARRRQHRFGRRARDRHWRLPVAAQGGNARRAIDRRHRRPAQCAQDQGDASGDPQRDAGRGTSGDFRPGVRRLRCEAARVRRHG